MARLAALNGSSEGRKTNSAAKQVEQPTTVHSNSLAIPEHSVPSFVEAALLRCRLGWGDDIDQVSGQQLVNLIFHFKPESEKQVRFHEASKTAVPRFLSPDSEAMTGQAVPHCLYDHADSATAAEDNAAVTCKKRSSKQAAHPAATPNSSETPSGKPYVNWQRLLSDSLAATGDCWTQPCVTTKAVKTA